MLSYLRDTTLGCKSRKFSLFYEREIPLLDEIIPLFGTLGNLWPKYLLKRDYIALN